MTTNREFRAVDRHGAEMDFVMLDADMARETEAEMQYRIAYSNALKFGILPRDKMREMLGDQGIWSEAEDEKLQTAVRDVATLELKLSAAQIKGEHDECTNIAKELAKCRQEMFKLWSIQQGVYVNSCEGYAEVVRQESLTASCVIIKANGKRYWEDYKSYVTERDENDKATVAALAMDLRNEILNEEYNQLTADYPEHRYLKESAGRLAEQLQQRLVDAKEELKERTEKIHADSMEGEAAEAEGDSAEADQGSVEGDAAEVGGLDEQDSDASDGERKSDA